MAVAQQPNWLSSHWPYLLGAVLLHAAIAAVFGLAMTKWRDDATPPMLAIEAFIVDEQQLAKMAPPPPDRERERREAEARAAEELRLQQEAAQAEEQRQAQEREQERLREEQVVREREEQKRIAQQVEEQRAREQREREEAERKRKLEAERQAKLEAEKKAEAERQRVEEIQRKQREREEAERKRRQAEIDARERALQNELAAEEELMRARTSGAMSQYQAMIQQHVERRWSRPGSARPGIECLVNVTQSPNGTVLRVQVGRCNGDQAVRQSIENAVQKASPLPLPPDMRLFERNLQFIFKPAD